MAAFIEILEAILRYVVEICTICLEFAGMIVLVSTAFICFVMWLRRDRENIRLDLAQGIALALEFKMGGEVLRTVVVREWGELVILGAIIILRAALTFLIHWEIENEKKEMENVARARLLAQRRKAAKKRREKRKNSSGNYTESENDSDSGEDSLDELPEVEMTYEENFRRPSLGRPAAHKDDDD